MTNEAPPDPTPRWEKLEGWDRTLAQMMDTCILPEVEKRQARSLLPTPVYLWAAQVLFPETGPNRVLLNDEVGGEALLRAPRAVEKGEGVTINDLEHLERYELPDDLLDCGHFTIFRSADKWGMFFNFLSGRAKARDMLEAANQFLDTSKQAADKGYNGPAVENMFTACELISKAELILHRDPAVKSKTHGSIKNSINQWRRLGNIDGAFVELFNNISRQRPNARYGDLSSRPLSPTGDQYEIAKMMIERGLQRAAKSTDEPII